MACNHDSIRCTNGVFYCLKCGEKLPAGFTLGKESPAAVEAAEKPAEGQKTATKRTRKGAK